jgi:hypothetical protein
METRILQLFLKKWQFERRELLAVAIVVEIAQK